MIDFLLDWDTSLEQYIYLHRYNDADSFLTCLTVHATYISFTLLFLLVIIYLINKKQIYLYVAINAALVNGITALFTNTLKALVKRPRPYEVNDLIDISPLINGGGYSFPSGHTTEVFALFFTISLLLKNKSVSTLFLFWALLIAYTRMYFGVHYPLDILGGIIVSAITDGIWVKYQPLKKWFKNLNE